MFASFLCSQLCVSAINEQKQWNIRARFVYSKLEEELEISLDLMELHKCDRIMNWICFIIAVRILGYDTPISKHNSRSPHDADSE
jgi:hypothetical protein